MQPESATIARVTGDDLLKSLGTVTEKLAKIEYAVDNFPGRIESLTARVERNTEDLANMKQWRSFWVGVTSVIALLLTSGVIAAIITAVHR